MKQYNKNIRGKLFKYFSQRLGLKKSTKGWYRTDCYWCKGHHTMGIHLQFSKVKCFKCEEVANPIKLLMQMENFNEYTEVWKFLSLQQDYDAYEDVSRVKLIEKPVVLPETFTLISQGDNVFGRAARHYMRKRGFSIEKLSMLGVGYCHGGKHMGYIIFPCYKRGVLVYYQGRKFMDLGPKMKNPEDTEFGIGKTKIIYNEDALYIYNRVHMVESITNSLTLGDNCTAFLGKKLSDHQISAVIKSPCSRVSLLLDPDAWGEAIETAMQLVQFKKVKLTKLPDEKDVNDLGRSRTLELVKKEEYKSYTDLLKLKWKDGKRPEYTYQRVGSGYSSSRGAS